ncbi:hypothetical protein ACXR0O_20450 [Verrucomicrobiota bacterium sgz303538]
MEPEQETRLRHLIDELDGTIPKEGVYVSIKGRNEYGIVANQRGYLRLGIEFLRAAIIQQSPRQPGNLDLDLDYLIAEDTDEYLYWFERTEDVPKRPSESAQRHHPVAQYLLVAFVSVILLAVIGFVTVVLWLVRVWPRLGYLYSP